MNVRALLLLASACLASSVFAATGEVGAAKVTMHALLNYDATTDVEIDSNGTIARVELGSDDVQIGDRTRILIKQHGLMPEEPIHVRTYVVFGDPNHHDVVDLDEIVRRRPDLFVAEIFAPQSTITGVPTIIRATVRELNGDVGATATCRLYANNIEVDRVEEVSIDAGGTVQCAFAPVFDLTGRHELAVVADSIAPGDWDESNNASAIATIDISDAASGGWAASVREEAFANHQRIGSIVRDTSGVVQSFRFEAWLRQDVAFVSSLRATSNGEMLFSGETPVAKPGGARCALTFGAYEVTACDVPSLGVTRIDLFHGSGAAVHRSVQWQMHFAKTNASEEVRAAVPIAARFDRSVEMEVTLGRFRKSVTVPLRLTTSTFDADAGVARHEERSMLTGVFSESRKGGFALK